MNSSSIYEYPLGWAFVSRNFRGLRCAAQSGPAAAGRRRVPAAGGVLVGVLLAAGGVFVGVLLAVGGVLVAVLGGGVVAVLVMKFMFAQ